MAVRTRSLFRAYEKIEKVLAGFLSFHQCMAEVERLSAGDLSPQLRQIIVQDQAHGVPFFICQVNLHPRILDVPA